MTREVLHATVGRRFDPPGGVALVRGAKTAVTARVQSAAYPVLRHDMHEQKARAEALEDAIAELAAHIHAATYRLLELVAEYDRGEYWAAQGFKSCAAWLGWRVGLGSNAAREKVRVARALEGLPRVADALRDGRISYAKARAITRVATPDVEDDLLAIAEHGTAHHVETVCRLYRKASSTADAEAQARAQQAERYLHSTTDSDGMVVISARLPPVEGATVLRALEAAEHDVTASAQTPADLAEGVSAETPAVTAGGVSAETRPTLQQRRADALCALARDALASARRATNGGGTDHLQVVLHVDAAELASAEHAGCSHVESAGRVPQPTAQQAACDASLVVVSHDRRGRVVDIARKRRVVPPSLRRALRGRQPACAFPGCDHTRHLEAHHIRHWAHGGKTTLQNLALLCSHHHRALHEGRYSLRRDKDGALRFRSRRGALPAVPSLPRGEAAALRRARSDIDAATLGTWDGAPCDYDWAVSGLVRRAASAPVTRTVEKR